MPGSGIWNKCDVDRCRQREAAPDLGRAQHDAISGRGVDRERDARREVEDDDVSGRGRASSPTGTSSARPDPTPLEARTVRLPLVASTRRIIPSVADWAVFESLTRMPPVASARDRLRGHERRARAQRRRGDQGAVPVTRSTLKIASSVASRSIALPDGSRKRSWGAEKLSPDPTVELHDASAHPETIVRLPVSGSTRSSAERRLVDDEEVSRCVDRDRERAREPGAAPGRRRGDDGAQAGGRIDPQQRVVDRVGHVERRGEIQHRRSGKTRRRREGAAAARRARSSSRPRTRRRRCGLPLVGSTRNTALRC